MLDSLPEGRGGAGVLAGDGAGVVEAMLAVVGVKVIVGKAMGARVGPVVGVGNGVSVCVAVGRGVAVAMLVGELVGVFVAQAC